MAFTIILMIVLMLMMKVFRIKLMEPAGIYSVMWMLFILGGIMSLGSQYKFSYGGINWILITCCIAVTISSFFKSKIKIHEKTGMNRHTPLIPWKVLTGFIILGMCSIGYTMITTGVHISVFSNFSALQNTAHMSSVNRYANGGEAGSFMSQILGSFIYIAPLCAGYSFIFAKEKREKMICFSSVLPALLSMLLTAAKLSLVSFVMLFFVGFYTSYLFNKGQILTIKMKMVAYIGVAVIALYALFYLSFVLRIGSGEKNISKIIANKLMVYAFGHVQGFDIWFDRYAFKLDEYGIWKNTFLAISSKLGLAVKSQGVYGILSGSCTNVYTPFRALIEDVGPIFAIIVLIMFFAMIYAMLYKLVTGKKKYVLCQIIFAANTFWLVCFMVSAWTYTTYLLTFVVFGIFLYISFNVRFVWGKKDYVTYKKNN